MQLLVDGTTLNISIAGVELLPFTPVNEGTVAVPDAVESPMAVFPFVHVYVVGVTEPVKVADVVLLPGQMA